MIFVHVFGGPLSFGHLQGWSDVPTEGRSAGFSRGSVEGFVVSGGELR
jgi:hypothetical protein